MDSMKLIQYTCISNEVLNKNTIFKMIIIKLIFWLQIQHFAYCILVQTMYNSSKNTLAVLNSLHLPACPVEFPFSIIIENLQENKECECVEGWLQAQTQSHIPFLGSWVQLSITASFNNMRNLKCKSLQTAAFSLLSITI